MTSEPTEADSAPPPECPAHEKYTPLYGPEFAADPARIYDHLRQSGPVTRIEMAPGIPATLVLSYELALDVLRDPITFPKDPRRWQEGIPADTPVLPMLGYRPNCLFADGNEHARLRGAINDSLARVDLNNLRAYIATTAETLIQRIGSAGTADLVSEYARLVPLMVFNQLFGCPTELGDRFVADMSAIFDAVDSEKANADLTEAILELIAVKRAEPGADVTSWLMAHPTKLTDVEMIHQIVVLLGGGTEPTQNLIANGLRLLLSDDRFAGDLAGGSLPVEDALDEVLWTDPPLANYGATHPKEDAELVGHRIPANETVLISFAAANTDPSISSEQRAGNRAHLAWSAGPHACPAQTQARLIASVAIEKLLDALPDMELAVLAEQLEWRPGPFHRALISLPVRFSPIVSTQPIPSLGDSRWNDKPVRTSSTQRAVTSTAKPQNSAPADRRRWWSFLAKWWRGQ
jgi:cytochrome P450